MSYGGLIQLSTACGDVCTAGMKHEPTAHEICAAHSLFHSMASIAVIFCVRLHLALPQPHVRNNAGEINLLARLEHPNVVTLFGGCMHPPKVTMRAEVLLCVCVGGGSPLVTNSGGPDRLF